MPRLTQSERIAATRAALISAARVLFATKGFAASSNEEIVVSAGVTRGALYHHFADKRDLFGVVFEVMEAEIALRIRTEIGRRRLADPFERMHLGAAIWLDVCIEPDVCQIAIIDAPAVLGLSRWREIGDEYGLALVKELLSEAVRMKRMAKQPIEPLGRILLGALREAASYLAASSNRGRDRKAVGAVIDNLINSLAV